MSEPQQMRRPWSVVGAGFNDEGVYFTFDDSVIDRRDINLMQAAPELLEALELVLSYHDDGNCKLHKEDVAMARAAIAKALGNH